MMLSCDRPIRYAGRALLMAAALAVSGPVPAQQDRERAQLLQMQQNLQRLQQDNSDLQSKLRQGDESLKKESAASDVTRRQLSAARAEASAKGKVLEALHAELDSTRESLNAAQAQIEQLRKDVAARDDALSQAAQRERRGEQAQSLLGDRLKQQTTRGDRCETKHAGVMTFASQVIDGYEQDRLRLCEPVTGIWKVHAESKIQELRSKLSTYDLDAPVEASR